jgi:uncharacterized protein YdhG (YjbR/CyaY superfamily)
VVTSKAATVDAFLKEQSEAARLILSKLRTALRTEVPEAAESMEHGMPTYRRGDAFWAFNAQKKYFSLYFSDFRTVAGLAKRFPKLECGTSCVRFQSFDQFPLADLRRAVRASVP